MRLSSGLMSLAGAQEFTTDVKASVDECFAAISDFDRYPSWSSAVQKIAVLDRYRDGLARRVEFHIDMKLKTLRYVLEYQYEKPHHLTWKAVDGDVEAIEGTYDFEKLGPKHTQVTCRQAVTIGFWVPGMIRTMIERTALQRSVLEFKAEAETRAGKAPRGQRTKKRA
jgi:ribosome-associated toxin RatA of RatAB toxin-antitoxin module